MKNSEFVERTKQFFSECLDTMNTKGIEYSGEDDKFANFKRLSTLQDLPAESIWLTYFTKHFDSLVSFIKKRNAGQSVDEIEKGLSEPIHGRIMDMINYLFILDGMIDEQRNGKD